MYCVFIPNQGSMKYTTKFTFLHGIKACNLKFELCHNSSDFKKLKTPCVGLNLLRSMYPQKRESVRIMVQ